MLSLTGATGTVGLPVLTRLTAARVPVRCLVSRQGTADAERLGVLPNPMQAVLGVG